MIKLFSSFLESSLRILANQLVDHLKKTHIFTPLLNNLVYYSTSIYVPLSLYIESLTRVLTGGYKGFNFKSFAKLSSMTSLSEPVSSRA